MNNRTAIITGAAKRIGAAITRELHRAGMDVVIHFNSSKDAASQLAMELDQLRPDSARAIQADLKHPDAWPNLINSALSFNGRLDVLINNASAFYPTSFPELTDSDWNEFMDTNLKAPLFLSQLAAPHLSVTKGCIINLADIYADRPLKNHVLYCVSKAGLIMLTKSLAMELAPEVRVNAISPGAIFWHANMSEEEKSEILQKIPMGSSGEAKDISNAVSYLVDGANYTTGQVLVIDGGRSLFS